MNKKKIAAVMLMCSLTFTALPAVSFAADSGQQPGDAAQQPADPAQNPDGTVQPADPAQEPQHAPGWSEDKKYYYDENGQLVTGVRKIDGKLYYFSTKDDSKGKLVTKKGLISWAGNKYYCLGKTKKTATRYTLDTGWRAIGKKAYYFDKKQLGAAAKNRTVGYLKIGKKGYLGETYALGIKSLNKSGWSLKKAYRTSVKLGYANRWMRKKSVEDYALVGFKKKKGNCYVMAATFFVKAKLLGYDVRQIAGRVDMPHSWTQIKHKGKWYVYDPNFEHEQGRSGWKFRYGKKGTWRYRNYHTIQRANSLTK